MALYIEGLHPIPNGHLVRAGALVPGLCSTNDAATLWVGPYTTVQGGIQHAGAVILCRGSVTWKPIRGGQEVIIGAQCIVPDEVHASGRVIVQAGARVEGAIHAGGDVQLLGDCTVADVHAGGDILVVGSPTTGELDPKGRVRTRGW